MAMALAESITLPPPTARTKSELLLPADADAFPHEAQARVGLHAAELDELDARVLQGRADPVVEARFLDAAAAEVEKDLLRVLRASPCPSPTSVPFPKMIRVGF